MGRVEEYKALGDTPSRDYASSLIVRSELRMPAHAFVENVIVGDIMVCSFFPLSYLLSFWSSHIITYVPSFFSGHKTTASHIALCHVLFGTDYDYTQLCLPA